MRRATTAWMVLLGIGLLSASPALAGSILYVSDSTTDSLTIPDVLSGGSAEVAHPDATIASSGGAYRAAAGTGFHDVTIVRFDYQVTGGGPFPMPAEGTNQALAGDLPGVNLSDYDAVYWSASGPHEPDLFGGGLGTDGGLHNDPDVFASLSSYVEDGGWVFVTGHDALADPGDRLLVDFVAGGDFPSAFQFEPAIPTAISSENSFLTNFVTDIRGLVPGAVEPGGVAGAGDPDLDGIFLPFASETLSLVTDETSSTSSFWTVRVPSGDRMDPTVGRIAYVANGIPLIEDLPFDDPPTAPFVLDGEDPSWALDPAYNGALLNFAAAAAIPEPSTTLLLGGGLIGLAWRRRTENRGAH